MTVRDAAGVSPSPTVNGRAGVGTSSAVVWSGIAVIVGASGLYYDVPAPVIGAVNGLLVTLTLLAVYFIQPMIFVRLFRLR